MLLLVGVGLLLSILSIILSEGIERSLVLQSVGLSGRLHIGSLILCKWVEGTLVLSLVCVGSGHIVG